MATVLKRYAVAWLLVLAGFAVVLALYPRMPAVVPTHWDAHGRVNGSMPKQWGAFIGPLVGLGMVALLSVLPRISPDQFSMERFARVWTTIVTGLAAFIFVVTVAITLAGAGLPVDVARIIAFAIGGLFALLGNFMGKLTPNFFAGIRTPWTLSNDEVWLRTHRLGGRLFFGAGLAAAVGAVVSPEAGLAAILTGAVVAGVVPVVYSYLLHRKLTPGGTANGAPPA
jgi:uncharacterized membrane protein